MKRNIILFCLMVLFVISHNVFSQTTEEFNNQQKIYVDTSYSEHIHDRYIHVTEDDSNFVIVSSIVRRNENPMMGLMLSSYDQSLGLEYEELYIETDTTKLFLNYDPTDLIYDGDSYLACGEYVYLDANQDNYSRPFVLKAGTNVELKEYSYFDSVLTMSTIEEIDNMYQVAYALSGSYCDTTGVWGMSYFLRSDLSIRNAYRLSQSGAMYVDEAINGDDDDFVLLAEYGNDPYYGMVLSKYDGTNMVSYIFLPDSIGFQPFSIDYSGGFYYVAGVTREGSDPVLIKLQTDLDVEWMKVYTVTDTSSQNSVWVEFLYLTAQRGNEIVLAGVSGISREMGPLVIKTDQYGTVNYCRFLGETSLPERVFDVMISADNSIVLSGEAAVSDDLGGAYLLKSDTRGGDECDWLYPEVEEDEYELIRTNATGTFFTVAQPYDVDITEVEVELEQVDVCEPSIKVNYGDDAEVYTGFFIAPNPAESSVDISFEIGEEAQVSLGIYDMTGRKVIEVFGGEAFGPGPHAETVDLKGLPNGIYNVVLEYGGKRITNKLSIIK